MQVGNGADTVHGGDGNDSIAAGDGWGNNYLTGGAGDDQLIGGSYYYSRATLLGSAGNDTLDGGGGRNLLQGGAGDDMLRATYEDDNPWYDLYYNQNQMHGGEGHDSIIAGGGNDTLFGAEGDDMLLGSFGDDFIFGGAGYDVVTGGAGVDRFFASTEETDVTVSNDYDSTEGDWLVLDGTQFSRDNLRLFGERMYDLEGNLAEYRNLNLVYVGDDGSLEQTLFAFANASELEQLIIRLPMTEGESGETIYLDLF